MRRLSALIVLAILVSMAGVRVPAPTAAASHGDQATTGLTALGRHAAVKLLRDAGLEMARTEIPAHALRAVVIDLDKDGDSDLVANVGSLELGVWLNDGTGRLTRAPKNAPAAPSWAPVPPTPSFETDGPEQAATSPDDAPTMRFEPIRAGPVPQPVAILTRDAAPAVAFEAADPSSPRAPPLA